MRVHRGKSHKVRLRREWRDKGLEEIYQTWKTNKGDPTNVYLVFPNENGRTDETSQK